MVWPNALHTNLQPPVNGTLLGAYSCRPLNAAAALQQTLYGPIMGPDGLLQIRVERGTNGFGITYSGNTVLSLILGGAAEKQGMLLPGDKVATVNGILVGSRNLGEVLEAMPMGSYVFGVQRTDSRIPTTQSPPIFEAPAPIDALNVGIRGNPNITAASFASSSSTAATPTLSVTSSPISSEIVPPISK